MSGRTGSPIAGQAYHKVRSQHAAVTTADKAAAEKLSQLRGLEVGDLDLYVEKLDALQKQSGVRRLANWESIKAPPQPRHTDAQTYVSEASERIQTTLATTAKKLSDIYSAKTDTDPQIFEDEVLQLLYALPQIRSLLDLRESGALQMLPRDVRGRLEENLFSPLQQIARVAHLGAMEVSEQLKERDSEALRKRLQAPLVYAWVDPKRGSIQGLDRYTQGDRIVVPKSSGGSEIGVVVGSEPQGLRVAVLRNQTLALKSVTTQQLTNLNPLKLGDAFTMGGETVRVSGVGADGRAMAIADGGTSYDGSQLQKIAETLAEQADHASATQVGGSKTISEGVHIRAGGHETVTRVDGRPEVRWLDKLTTSGVEGGLFTSRGPNEIEHGTSYKSYNEDAALLGAYHGQNGQPDIVVVGAFDQAGGMGNGLASTGAASALAAQHVQMATELIARGEAKSDEDILRVLQGALLEAHAAIGKLQTGDCTTASVAIIRDGKAYVVSAGDSKLRLFGADGRLKRQTKSHNVYDELVLQTGDVNNPLALNWANRITSSIGTSTEPQFVAEVWPIGNGDYLLATSDSVEDANLIAQQKAAETDAPFTRTNGEITNRHLEALVQNATSGGDLALAVAEYALGQVREGHGKPDNTTAVAIRVR